jgi:hypothetical protein
LGPSRTPVGVRLGKVKPFFLDTQGKLHQWGDTTQFDAEMVDAFIRALTARKESGYFEKEGEE